ncbi:MAG: tyrosine-type recombinase/integrase [Yokenella regensburgei]|jgi:integrase|nr:tyrosine-type recombinase/integrase [Yokenella regensburgei]
MAHIRESGTGKGRRFVVRYRNEKTGENATARLKTLDEAMHLFWLAETSLHQVTPLAESQAAICRWPVRKVVWYWLGHHYARSENGNLSPDSYRRYRHLLKLPESLLSESVGKVTPRQMNDLLLATVRRENLRQAFGLLVSRRWLVVNPIGSLPGRPERVINLPSKKTIVAMLAAAQWREKIAILLGAVCGLRPCELMSLRYSDLSAGKIVIRRHLTRSGELPGIKHSKKARPVDMPEELWALLDKSLLGSDTPVIAGRGGRRLSLNYTNSGVIQRLLDEYGVERYYDLRHFAITNYLRRGATMAEGAEFAGHKNPAITAKYYTHLLGEKRGLSGSLEGN